MGVVCLRARHGITLTAGDASSDAAILAPLHRIPLNHLPGYGVDDSWIGLESIVSVRHRKGLKIAAAQARQLDLRRGWLSPAAFREVAAKLPTSVFFGVDLSA